MQRLQLLPYPSHALKVTRIAAGAGSSAVVHTADPHPFSGAAQLASLAGLPGELDGLYPVTASDKKKSRMQFTIELFKGVPAAQKAAVEAAVQQAAAAGGVTVRWAVCDLNELGCSHAGHASCNGH